MRSEALLRPITTHKAAFEVRLLPSPVDAESPCLQSGTTNAMLHRAICEVGGSGVLTWHGKGSVLRP